MMNLAVDLPIDLQQELQAQTPSAWIHRRSHASGPDAEQLDAATRQAERHWYERPTVILMRAEIEPDLTYQHLPFATMRTVRARIRSVGRLPAREFTLDEE